MAPRFVNHLPSSEHWPHDHQNSAQYRMDPAMTDRVYSLRPKKKFVLCFDGTGNKFSGTESDSNILKIYRMLDRNDDAQFHYYQPGIGTYVVAHSMSQTSRLDRLKSWYAKGKDSAVGTSFDEHVMGGYKFLMRYYLPGDDIFLFGFSRGAYTARFLAEMLDHVGLLSAGNEEMCRFAWKTFQKWQCRQERTAKEKKQKKNLLEFMCAFRETFSRPVRSIRFLGLFDTVNSVPRFENTWMQRSKFPYTARSSAKVIRHAVAIDERRAKFRQDLISQTKPDRAHQYKPRYKYRHPSVDLTELNGEQRRGRKSSAPQGRRDTLTVPERICSRSEASGVRNLSPGLSLSSEYSRADSISTSVSNLSLEDVLHYNESDSDDDAEQDIGEVWFAGCHADIGGGWPLGQDENVALSHVPLVWMVREAQRAGLNFDAVKLHNLNCGYSPELEPPVEVAPEVSAESHLQTPMQVPIIEIDPATPSTEQPDPISSLPRGSEENGETNEKVEASVEATHHHHHHLRSKFHTHFHTASTKGKIHDVLHFHNGASRLSVIIWNIMEYLPFRRMDLQEDGTWKSITWPLPKGEVRDIPEDAVIHASVLRRMEADPNYRPGNLIVGGGGRGVRQAPKELGMGKWKSKMYEGDAIGEGFVRAAPPERKKEVVRPGPFVMTPNGPQGIGNWDRW